MNLEEETRKKYRTETKKVENERGWNSIDVTMYRISEEEKVITYRRNYPTLHDTFYPFVKNGKEYALYSPEYTGTRLMDLKTGKDIGGEDRNMMGFCPVEYYVPQNEDEDQGLDASFGFVAGCVWGDDSSYKIQWLDLSLIEEGIIKRDDRLGYVVLPSNIKLRDAVDMSNYYDVEYDGERIDERNIDIATPATYHLTDEGLKFRGVFSRFPDREKL